MALYQIMKKIIKLFREISGVRRVLRTADFFRWLALLLRCFFKVLRTGSLGPVDEAYGSRVEFRSGSSWLVIDNGSLGVVREIIASHCYIHPEELADACNILDLGANCGVFTLFALSSAANARVVSVEAQPQMANVARANITANGFHTRVLLHNAYAGEPNVFIDGLRKTHPQLSRFDPDEYIRQVGCCDFLKCDIEGAEYSLITERSFWLKKVRRMSLEYHGTWEDGAKLKRVVEGHGFAVRQTPHGNLGYLMCSRVNNE